VTGDRQTVGEKGVSGDRHGKERKEWQGKRQMEMEKGGAGDGSWKGIKDWEGIGIWVGENE